MIESVREFISIFLLVSMIIWIFHLFKSEAASIYMKCKRNIVKIRVREKIRQLERGEESFEPDITEIRKFLYDYYFRLEDVDLSELKIRSLRIKHDRKRTDKADIEELIAEVNSKSRQK